IDPNGSNPTKYEVFDYIQDAYETWEVPPEYVMIVGDEDNTYNTGIEDYPYSNYASDHPYSMVDGSDYLPDIFVSRYSVDNMSQLRIGIAKILAYESNPNMADPDHWLRGLSVAGNVHATTPRLTTLWARYQLLNRGFTRVDTCFSWYGVNGHPNIDPGPAPILASMNNGVSIVSYRGWAGSGGWYNPSFSSSNLNQVQNNNKLGVMASIVCGTGNFGYGQCFGEVWIRMGSSPTSYKGGPAFFGSTDPGTHTRWNNPIMTGYYWGILAEDIYHFAAAAVRGKIQQYNTFPRFRSSYIRQYFHTYNMLGDPELEVRTAIPKIINVSHPLSLTHGINHIQAIVTDGLEQPVEGAYVTLVKSILGEDDVFEVGKTDAFGNISFTFDASSIGTMYLTVSGRDLYPYQGTVLITRGELAVGHESHAIDDDNSGYSSGDGDGIANPGETIELSVDLKNFSDDRTAYDINVVLDPFDAELATVYDADRSFGDIGAGEIVSTETPFVIRIDPHAQDSDEIWLKTTATDSNNDSWESLVEILVEAPKFRVISVSFPGGNGRLDPGETSDMVLTLENIGSADAQGVTATVVTMDDYTSIESERGIFGSIPAGGSGNNSLNPMVISSDPGTFDGRTLNLMLHTATSSGAQSSIPFTVTVGIVLSSDPVGPDAYGYYMFDNTDAGYAPQPTYDWVEIVPNLGGQGTRLYFSNNDDYSVQVNLPFDFIYYGQEYSRLIVCTNGFAAVDTVAYDMDDTYWHNFSNWPIPDPGNAEGQISPFWDDLEYSGSTYGVYTWHDEDNHRFVIEWYHMSHRNTGATETFEMIITDPAYYPTITGDAEFYYQYQSIVNNDSGELYSSVGFESYDQLRGIEYTFDNTYAPGAATLTSGRAIKITTNTGRGAVRGNVDLNNFGFNQDVKVAISAGQYRITPQSGDYWIKDVPPGTFDVTAEIRGYFPMTSEGIDVEADMTTGDIDFSMTRCPRPENLEASEGLGDRIELTWDAVDHPDMVGYNVLRGKWESSDFEMLNEEPITETTFTDLSVPDNDVYWYYITAVYSGDYGEAESFASNYDSGTMEDLTGTDDERFIVPENFFISQNYPNPFNPVTTISYGLPGGADVRIEIYNILGQNVRTLVDERQAAGYRSIIWDGNDDSGNQVSTGVYFYRIEADDYHASKKMLLIK
ncbi:MAG: C25 family cysteine peptidase, partial [candidate division Zixibacteria bacterium]